MKGMIALRLGAWAAAWEAAAWSQTGPGGRWERRPGREQQADFLQFSELIDAIW